MYDSTANSGFDPLHAIGSAANFVGDVLDTPGALLRNTLSGRNPFAGLLDPQHRASGRDVLEHYGVLGANQDGFDPGDAAGFLAEMALDPTNLIGGGVLKKMLGLAGAAKLSNARRARVLGHGAMPEEIAKLTKIVDESGKPLRTYHGTPRAFGKYDVAKLDPNALYGKGIYATDTPALASEYTQKGAEAAAEIRRKPGAAREIAAKTANEEWIDNDAIAQMSNYSFVDPPKAPWLMNASKRVKYVDSHVENAIRYNAEARGRRFQD